MTYALIPSESLGGPLKIITTGYRCVVKVDMNTVIAQHHECRPKMYIVPSCQIFALAHTWTGMIQSK